jgi:large subunit ribosomal protein L23
MVAKTDAVKEKKTKSVKTKSKKASAALQKKKAAKATKVEQTVTNYDPWNVLLYPSMSEKSIRLIEAENKIAFIVRQNATKAEIKRAFENAFTVKVAQITTVIDQDAHKKAFIRLSKEFLASDIATRLGII